VSAQVSAREVARRVLDRIDKDGAWATPALDGELARAGLEDRDRRLASELVYGVLRHKSRIDRALAAHANLKKTHPKVLTALRVATYQLLFLDRIPGHAAVNDAVAAARAVAGPKLGGFTNAVLRKLSQQGEPPLPEGDLELAASLPRWILDELSRAAGDRTPEIAAALAAPAPLIARANRRKTTREALIAELEPAGITATPVGDAMALRLEGLGDPGKNAAFLAGKWTVQDLGAQSVALAAAPRGGQRILDACAGVGGKSTHLAELIDDQGTIDAADLSATKLGLCGETAARLGLTSIRRHACDLLDPDAPLGAAYDLIVLDAPCSGLGVLRRHPDAKWRLKPTDVPRLADLQRQLLDAVVPRLAPGGTLVYSVCTFTMAEGPEQIAKLVARTGLRLVEEHRTWPPAADAFYLARLERAG
jgi:16S rRNA (cytosine967-C5)-methyltransferase